MQTIPESDLPQEYNVLDNRIEFAFQKGMLKLVVNKSIWMFPISKLVSDDIMYIREIIEIKKSKSSKHVPPHACPGCITIPANGFSSYKFNWCRFSRNIARLQEEYIPAFAQTKPPELPQFPICPIELRPESTPSPDIHDTQNVWEFSD